MGNPHRTDKRLAETLVAARHRTEDAVRSTRTNAEIAREAVRRTHSARRGQ